MLITMDCVSTITVLRSYGRINALARENGSFALLRPGVIAPTQPKVPEAKVRGSQEGFRCVLVSPERAPGVRKGVRRGPVGPPGPPELAALIVTL